MNSEAIFEEQADLILSLLKECNEVNCVDDITHMKDGGGYYFAHHIISGIHIYTAIKSGVAYVSPLSKVAPYQTVDANPIQLRSIITNKPIEDKYIKKALKDDSIENMLSEDNQEQVAIVTDGNRDSVKEICICLGKGINVREKVDGGVKHRTYSSSYLRVTEKEAKGMTLPENVVKKDKIEGQYEEVDITDVTTIFDAITRIVNALNNQYSENLLSSFKKMYQNIKDIRAKEYQIPKISVDEDLETVIRLEAMASKMEEELRALQQEIRKLKEGLIIQSRTPGL